MLQGHSSTEPLTNALQKRDSISRSLDRAFMRASASRSGVLASDSAYQRNGRDRDVSGA